MHDLTVGIPLRSATSTKVATLLARAAQLNPAEVIVSINEHESAVDLAEVLREHPNLIQALDQIDVSIHVQRTNLGLYGNFRWLVDHAGRKFFLWCCEDDQPTTNQGSLVEVLESEPRLALAVPRQELWDWSAERGFIQFERALEAPSGSALMNHSNASATEAWPDPSWIFGTWRTHDLRKAMPGFDYDWLDFQLLIQLNVEGRIAAVDCGPALIGIQPGRPPAPVGRWFNPAPFCLLAARRSAIAGTPVGYGRLMRASAASVLRASYFLNAARLKNLATEKRRRLTGYKPNVP